MFVSTYVTKAHYVAKSIAYVITDFQCVAIF